MHSEKIWLAVTRLILITFLKSFINLFSQQADYAKLGWLVGFLTSSSTTRLYRGRAPRQSV